MPRPFLIASAALALSIASPAFAEEASPPGNGHHGVVSTQMTCDQHVRIVNQWMAQHQSSYRSSTRRQEEVALRNHAADACHNGDNRTAFLDLDRVRRMLDMPAGSVAQADIDQAVAQIRQEQTAGRPDAPPDNGAQFR